MKTLSVTFITFNSFGNELLVNLGGEQLYLYDFVTYDVHSSSRLFKFDSYAEIFKKETIYYESPFNLVLKSRKVRKKKSTVIN